MRNSTATSVRHRNHYSLALTYAWMAANSHTGFRGLLRFFRMKEAQRNAS